MLLNSLSIYFPTQAKWSINQPNPWNNAVVWAGRSFKPLLPTHSQKSGAEPLDQSCQCTPGVRKRFASRDSFNSKRKFVYVCNLETPECKITCSCTPFLSLLLICKRIRPFFSSETRSKIIPKISMFCSPPSRPQVRDIFSSTFRCTLSHRRNTQATDYSLEISIYHMLNKLLLDYQVYLSVFTGGWRTLDISEPFFPALGIIIFSPSDLSLSTKLSISFPLAPSFSALLGPLGLEMTKTSC